MAVHLNALNYETCVAPVVSVAPQGEWKSGSSFHPELFST